MGYDIEQVNRLAAEHGLMPWATPSREGSAIWECWADRVLNIACNGSRWDADTLADHVRDCNAYSGSWRPFRDAKLA